MAPYVACHIALLWLRSRIHNVYTVPLGTEKKPKARGNNGVRGSLLCSPLLPAMFLPFHPAPIHHSADSPTDDRADCLCPGAGRSFQQENKSIPVRSNRFAGEGERAQVLELPC